MKRTVEEHASRFDAQAAEYDDSQDSEAYRACANLVIELADPGPDDVVLDIGTGTGAIALALADDAKRVVGRDISEGMLEKAREKAATAGIENGAESTADSAGSRTGGSGTVEFGEGRFREPNYDGEVDIVVSNFAMHHLSDEEKREAIETIAALDPRKFVLGDVMFFGKPDPDEPFYSPEVDDPATVGTLVEAFTEAGLAVTGARRVHDQVGVLVGERLE
ncbi:class I SAM-dependent methyltransferase [Halalkalicoccus ordinarius]|uniref:class I SAM-dependent methyltransferase n=1 Tax=Halalkalicoccus ordinarius TaxID=3116651 RepID=UPI00300F4EC1